MKKFDKKDKGSALFVALILSFIGLLSIGALVSIWYRLTQVIFPIKIYSSVREAAGGGIRLLSTYVDQGFFYDLERGECPGWTTPVGNLTNATVSCCQVNIKYRLLGDNREYENPVVICFLGYQPRPGDEIAGVAYTPQAAKFGKNFVYGFNSTAYGPGNVTAYVEAVYVR